MDLTVENWGLVDYREALDRQLRAHDEIVGSLVSTAPLAGKLIFCSHPPVVTLGRKYDPVEIQGWKGETLEVARGGKSTYHGPSQLVCYPILNLNHPSFGRVRDIGWYLRALEAAIVRLLADDGIEAEGRAFRKGNEGTETAGGVETGVWVGGKKIASLGIGIRSWVTFHGAALNLTEDPQAFVGLRPCGFEASIMTNAERISGRKINAAGAAERWARYLVDELLRPIDEGKGS